MNQNAMRKYDLFLNERQRKWQGREDVCLRHVRGALIELGNAVPGEGAAGAKRCVTSRSSTAQRSLN